MRWLVVVVVLVTGACAARKTVVVSDEAKAVKVSSMEQVAECHFLSMVTCHNGANFGAYEDNVNACMDEARQKTHDQGGTHFVLDQASMDSGGATWATAVAGAGDCRNCVSVTGKAYRCEEKPAPKTCLDIQSDYQECLDSGGVDPTKQ